MEVVRVFNNELSSLYEVKPPISKAKMTQITKSAIKGIKFYKHIVQSVEKFIQKCRPEYKVPGLYVVDSIVRQSRHQFGADKDVFGPRFVKNINATFQHLFKCGEDDRCKIIRVLNLWQKNAVFPSDVIQPLLDMGHPNTSNEWPLDTDAPKESPVKIKEEPRHKSDSWKGWPQANDEPVQDNKPYAEMSTKNLEKFNKAEMSNAAREDEASRTSVFKAQVKLEKTPEETVKFNKKLLDFDYGDEEDEEEVKNEESHLSAQPNALALSMAQNLLSNPELLRQLQQMTASTMQQPEPLKDVTGQPHQPKSDDMDTSYSQDMQSSPHHLIPPTSYQQPMPQNRHLSKGETDTDDRVLPDSPLPSRDLDERSLASVMASHDRLLPGMCLPPYSQTGVAPKPPLPDKDDRMIPDPTMPPQDLDERSLASIIAPERAAMSAIPFTESSSLLQFQFDKNGVPYQTQPPMPMLDTLGMDPNYPPVLPPDPHIMQNSQADEDERVMYSMPGEPPLPPQDFDERQIMLPVEERIRKERSRSRSGSRSRGRGGRRRSRSRSPRRKRSRSRSHSRKNRSRSRDRGERIREKERERERERERRRKGIPPVKKGCVSICSTTLWLGHVPKSCSEVDISNTFGPFGTILSIDMIPPRGCAYVVMDRRQDGYKALQKLKNIKLQGSSIKIAWAPGKGVKGKEFKDYWEVDLGVSYIPYEKIKEDPEFLDFIEEGGFIDEDSLPENLKALRSQVDDEKGSYNARNKAISDVNAPYGDMQAAPNMVPPPIMPPTSVGIPMVLPHLMQPQFGLHLPGMLPPQAMVMQVPMGIPPPAPMLMVQQQSQGLLGNPPLPMVGGVPPVPRTIPPAANSLPNLKSSVKAEAGLSSASVLPSTGAGDATPVEEEGTNVSSPSVQASNSCTSSATTGPAQSNQPVVSMAQFNQMLGLNTSRSMLSVPPPVSTAGTPIPYPPPNMGFNFPPPGIRPPGPPNSQFPWMQKQVSSPFTDADSSQSTSSTPVRPVPPPQSGMPVHMFSNRLPFHDPQSSSANVNSPMKEPHKVRENAEQNLGDENSNRNSSPGHHDKMIQEMVISTDDESSMDIEYPRNDMPPGPCYPGIPEFSRNPMNMQRMRGPPGPMPPGPGPRFRGMPMGSPFPMRMGGPRGMGGPGMQNRMDMDYPPHHGSRGGPRMPMGPHGPRRNDMHNPHDGRDWYPRDFEGPPYERERERRYHDDWNREPWDVEGNERRNARERDEGRRPPRDDLGRDEGRRPQRDDLGRDEGRRPQRDNLGRDEGRRLQRDDLGRDDHRDSWNRDRSERPRDVTSAIDIGDPAGRPRDKHKGNKVLDDVALLRAYQRGNSYNKSNHNDQPRDKLNYKDNEAKKTDSNVEPHMKQQLSEQSNNEKDVGNEQSRREREREARKRSRWGRTLSEEREIQQQKRNEVELKFQSYERSHVAQHPPNTDVNHVQNSDEMSLPNNKAEHVESISKSESITDTPNILSIPQSSSDALTQSTVEIQQNETHIPIKPEISGQNETHMPIKPEVFGQNETLMPIKSEISEENETSILLKTEISEKNENLLPSQTDVEMPLQSKDNIHSNEFLLQNASEPNLSAEDKFSTDPCTEISQTESSNSYNNIGNDRYEMGVTESSATSSCNETVCDLNTEKDNAIKNCTPNESNLVPDDVITNNSVSTES